MLNSQDFTNKMHACYILQLNSKLLKLVNVNPKSFSKVTEGLSQMSYSYHILDDNFSPKYYRFN